MSREYDKVFKLSRLQNPKCRACPLWKSSVNVCVMGRGTVDPLIHLIGEAPGRREAETGLPFMGQAGKEILNPILEELELTELVYISNVCRCRPPSNRKPTTQEMKTCSSLYLEKEIGIVKPRIIVAMGKTAAEWLFGKILPNYGTLVIERDLSGCGRMRTWHPAYCLPGRGGKVFRNRLRDHLRAAKEFATQLERATYPVTIGGTKGATP
jgi:DNA polymerase